MTEPLDADSLAADLNRLTAQRDRHRAEQAEARRERRQPYIDAVVNEYNKRITGDALHAAGTSGVDAGTSEAARIIDLSQVSAYVWTDASGEQRRLRPDEVDIVLADAAIAYTTDEAV